MNLIRKIKNIKEKIDKTMNIGDYKIKIKLIFPNKKREEEERIFFGRKGKIK